MEIEMEMERDASGSEEPRGLERTARRSALRDALVAHDRDAREVGLDPERGVERIRLRTCLRRRGVRGGRRGLARRLRGRVRPAGARELAADEVGDHPDRVGGAWIRAGCQLQFGSEEKGQRRRGGGDVPWL